MLLHDIIIQSIEQYGPIRFRDFMDMALYHPQLGYYMCDKEKIGTEGDYFTAPVLSSLFGEVIGRQMEEMWHHLGRGEFIVVEYGAGTGALCNDVLNYLRNNSVLYENIRYCIIEKSETMRQKEKQLILHPRKVSWFKSIKDIGTVKGCVFSNELLDNFPVHRVVMDNKELKELFVHYDNGFQEITFPAKEELKEYLKEEQAELPSNYRTEINMEVRKWITDVAAALETGFVFTIDYGYPSWEFFHPQRKSGTLICYHNHRVSDNPYENPGKQDITAHVNFSALNRWGQANGLTYGGFTNQSCFLRSLGLVDYIRRMEQSKKQSDQSGNQLAELSVLLNSMGNRFKVLMQHKNVSTTRLTGMMLSLSL
jgi:SAM-dependent MidA family methyltransferase